MVYKFFISIFVPKPKLPLVKKWPVIRKGGIKS